MKAFFLTFWALILLMVADNGYTQVRTEGTKTEIDSVTGKTTTTTYVDVKKEEDITPRHDMIVINPLKFFLFYNLSYFHSFNNTIAVGLGGQIPTISDIGGFGLNTEVRIYPSKKALKGFYVAPNIAYNHLANNFSYSFEDASNYSKSVDLFSIGALVGWQWFPGDDFAIGLGIGIDKYFEPSSSGNYSIWYGSYTGVAPALRFDIGYGW